MLFQSDNEGIHEEEECSNLISLIGNEKVPEDKQSIENLKNKLMTEGKNFLK